MKPAELRKKTTSDLQKSVAGLQDKLRELRFGLHVGKVKNIKEIRATRREVARMKTILCQKENSQEK